MTKTAMMVRDGALAARVAAVLRDMGLAVVAVASAATLRRDLHRGAYAAVVLDAQHKGVALDALLDHRRGWMEPAAAVVAIGAGPAAARAALAAGADDYVADAAVEAELALRLEAALARRRPRAAAPCLGGDQCVLDRARASLRRAGRDVGLTARELAVAQLLFERVGEVVPRGLLADRVWGADESLVGRSIDQHIYQLRRKLKRCAGDAAQLRSVYGLGYTMELSTAAASAPATRAGARIEP